MEKQVTRFPHVAVKIFDYLDIRSLAWSRGVCKLWKKFIESSKFSWVKFIKGILKQLKQSEETQRQWKRVLFMADIKQIIGIADAVQRSACGYSYDIKQALEDFSPLLLLAKVDNSLNLYKDLCRTIPNDKINLITNDKNSVGYTCLHLAACSLNTVDIFSFIIEKAKDKNPKALGEKYDSVTPLHLAAWCGHLEICKIIIANVVDLSCLDDKWQDQTPSDAARVNGYLDICFYFNEVRNQSTLDIGWKFRKNIGLYFPKESKSTAVTTTTSALIDPAIIYCIVLFLFIVIVAGSVSAYMLRKYTQYGMYT
jgi:hypothetical protein